MVNFRHFERIYAREQSWFLPGFLWGFPFFCRLVFTRLNYFLKLCLFYLSHYQNDNYNNNPNDLKLHLNKFNNTIQSHINHCTSLYGSVIQRLFDFISFNDTNKLQISKIIPEITKLYDQLLNPEFYKLYIKTKETEKTEESEETEKSKESEKSEESEESDPETLMPCDIAIRASPLIPEPPIPMKCR